jgi:uncharacterized membrane protein YdbT with pleckstrin-like domain
MAPPFDSYFVLLFRLPSILSDTFSHGVAALALIFFLVFLMTVLSWIAFHFRIIDSLGRLTLASPKRPRCFYFLFP